MSRRRGAISSIRRDHAWKAEKEERDGETQIYFVWCNGIKKSNQYHSVPVENFLQDLYLNRNVKSIRLCLPEAADFLQETSESFWKETG